MRPDPRTPVLVGAGQYEPHPLGIADNGQGEAEAPRRRFRRVVEGDDGAVVDERDVAEVPAGAPLSL